MRKASIVAVVSVLAGVSVASAAPTSVRTLQTWTGHMPVDVQPLLQSSVAAGEDWKRVWTTCQLKGAPPKVDFDKRLVLVAVRRSSGVKFVDLKLDNGNLLTNIAVTPDQPNRMTCEFALVDRAGVTSVNGVPLGK